MVEQLRSITVEVKIDTNKWTYAKAFILGQHDEEETREELAKRVSEYIKERYIGI